MVICILDISMLPSHFMKDLSLLFDIIYDHMLIKMHNGFSNHMEYNIQGIKADQRYFNSSLEGLIGFLYFYRV